MNYFYATYNKEHSEYEIYRNGELFCHIHEIDFDLFKRSFLFEIEEM